MKTREVKSVVFHKTHDEELFEWIISQPGAFSNLIKDALRAFKSNANAPPVDVDRFNKRLDQLEQRITMKIDKLSLSDDLTIDDENNNSSIDVESEAYKKLTGNLLNLFEV